MSLRKSGWRKIERYGGVKQFQHWYRDNSVYFITARCRDGHTAFASEEAQAVFWDRFSNYTAMYGFVPWIVTLMNNHYHFLGYLKTGRNVAQMMRKLHGSVAKMVNDVLPVREKPFWKEKGKADYFDGCIRDELQCRRAYRYIVKQSVRHRICKDYREYSNTRVMIDCERGIARAIELKAFLPEVPYARYERKEKRRH
jgi:REP element-mobilizing transposase RayT